MEEQLLNPGDIAEILHVSKASAYLLLKRGTIPIVRIGKMVRVKRKDLDRYIYEKTSLGTKGEQSDASGAGQ